MNNQISSEKELIVLIRYMIAHNSSHNKELEEIADGLKENNLIESYEKVKEAIATFNDGNQKLEEALKLLKKE